MAVNLYEGPAEQRFIDTYAPLPFQELMQVGQQFQRERERTEQAIQEFYTEYGDFMSPSQRDIESMTQTTFGAFQPQLDRMRMDPEYLRSREGQAGIMQAIRGVDRSKIAQLRQGAEMLRERARLRAKLESEGRYKASWDPYADLSQYDTLAQGIISPSILEYQSMEELTKPYTSELKPGYMYHIDPYRYFTGITEEDVRRTLEPQFESITSTPQGQAWMRDIANEMAAYGITDPEAIREETLNRMVQTQKDRMVPILNFDEAALKLDELAIRRAKLRGEQQAQQQPLLMDQIKVVGQSYLGAISDMLNNNPTVAARNAELNDNLATAQASGNREAIANAQQQAAQAQMNDFANLTRNAFLFGAGATQFADVKDYANKADGASKAIDLYSVPVDANAIDDILSQVVGNRSERNGVVQYTTTDLSKFKTGVQVASQMNMGDVKVSIPKYGLENILKEGGVEQVQVVPVTGKNIVNQVHPDGTISQLAAVDVIFTEDDINKNVMSRLGKKISFKGTTRPTAAAEYVTATFEQNPAGIMANLIAKAGGKVNEIVPEETTSTTVSGRQTIQGQLLGTQSTTTTAKGRPKKVYRVRQYIEIPDERIPGQERLVSSINQANLRRETTANVSSGERPGVVEDAFNAALNQQSQNAAAIQRWNNTGGTR